MKEKKFLVYKHTSPVGKIYIGQTCQAINKRFRNGEGYVGSSHFYCAIQKYGWNNFSHEIISDNLTKSEADWLEIYMIEYYNSNNPEYGYNMANGGNTCAGTKRTEVFKKRLSEINAGKTLSEEHRHKISEYHTRVLRGKKHGRARHKNRGQR